MTQNNPPHKHPVKPPHQTIQAKAGLRPPSLAFRASLARAGFLTIRDIWAGPAPRGHRHEKQGARQKHHLHIIKQLGGSQRLPPAAAVLPGKAEEDTKWPGGGEREGQPRRESGLEFLRLAPFALRKLQSPGWFPCRCPGPQVMSVPKGDFHDTSSTQQWLRTQILELLLPGFKPRVHSLDE